jgi:hypothetical protein
MRKPLILEKPYNIKAISVLYISIVINIILFLSCYLMITNHENDMRAYIFEHKNNPLEHHPFEAKMLLRIEELDQKITIINDRCNNR